MIKSTRARNALASTPPQETTEAYLAVLDELSFVKQTGFARSVNDPLYFMTTFCGLEDRSALRDVVNGLVEHEQLMVKHPRAIGMTTTAVAHTLWKALFHPNQSILFAAVNSRMAVDAQRQFLEMYEGAIFRGKPELIRQSCQSFSFSNGTVVRFAGTSGAMACGLSLDMLVFDNFAANRYEMQNAALFQCVPALKSGATFLFASTPSSGQDVFSRAWAIFPHKLELGFHQLPEATQEYFRAHRLSLGLDAYWTECLGNFAHGELYESLKKANSFPFK